MTFPFRLILAVAAFIPALSHAQHHFRQPAATAPSLSLAEVQFDRFEENTLHFKGPEGSSAPKPLKTDLYDLHFLGMIKPPALDLATPAYVLISGRPCKSCQQESGIYAIRPSGGRPTAYVHPGKILDPKSRVVLVESRGFFGRCLARSTAEAYVVFQKERIDRHNQMESSVLIAEPGMDHMNEKLIERHLPKLQDTLRLVKAKSCHEVEGRNRLMLKKPLDTGTRRNAEESEGDEDPRENQTDNDAVSTDPT